MATYQEQLAKAEQSKTAKVMVALAELGTLEPALSILVREKIIDNEARIALLAKYVHQHPEIEQAMRARFGDTPPPQNGEAR